ncbi:zinc-binding alcohol dehydrogenase family protein [Desulfopila sp. IMCC35006]|uniref:zinc-dependent alcohol dehydrogenase family protein n=1 Tax=Desulfopila sp. IMCC35006 TaxID=2569542 RepID=UPI0010AC969B|nr:zinc-dependent alcohol dehydrogenase family protein [Desulfopila sp. IMCC35006]TKB27391.1 zinc-binding alcohol dehydrogenase family protein [Desulfopila sp. IMCC35006]
MKAMVLQQLCNLKENTIPLQLMDLPDPVPTGDNILVQVAVCGVCHTELDIIEGRTPPPRLPLIPGHQVVGRIQASGEKATVFKTGDTVGIAWIYSACGACTFCRSGRENLCCDFKATGRDADGGYAQYMTVPEDFAYPIPEGLSDTEVAPLLCAGAIGYRSLRLTGLQDGQNLGLTGFGASGHLVLKMVRHLYPKSEVFVFARGGEQQEFARGLGAVWAGETAEQPPEKLDCIIDTTPAWQPVVEALKNLTPGGRLVINAIAKEYADKKALLELDYSRDLWLEKEIKSVANITRRDVSEFLQLAQSLAIRPEVQEFSLAEANRALTELRTRRVRGAKVLRMD